MANSEHVNRLREHVDGWNRWRVQNPDIKPDLTGINFQGADLRGRDFTDADFSGATLHNVRFQECKLDRTNFTSCRLDGASFNENEIKKVNFNKSTLDNSFFVRAKLVECCFDSIKGKTISFKDAEIQDCDFTGDFEIQDSNFEIKTARNLNFTGGKIFSSRFSTKGAFHQVSFYQTHLADSSFEGIDFEDCSFSEIAFRGCRVEHCNFPPHTFTGGRYEGAQFTHSNLSNCTFTPEILAESKFLICDLVGTKFWGVNLISAKFQSSNLTKASFAGCTLESATFENCNLSSAKLEDVTVDAKTHFRLSKVKELKIDRFTLDCLEDNGGITKGAASELIIKDDLAELRKSYSGFMFWIHLWLFIIFLAPYVWFLGEAWWLAHKSPISVNNGVPIWEALLRYIVSGGHNWRDGWKVHWNVIPFLISLFYNLLRAFLVSQVKQIEAHQETTGFPVKFSLKNWEYRKIYELSKFFLKLNIVAVAIHTFNFLRIKIPL